MRSSQDSKSGSEAKNVCGRGAIGAEKVEIGQDKEKKTFAVTDNKEFDYIYI